jgi:hypothetical protein
MAVIVPKLRPNIGRDWIFQNLFRRVPQALASLQGHEAFIVCCRGFYKSMGNPDSNDFGLYDDSATIVTPSELHNFNANVDPSLVKKNVAQLPEGVIWFKKGLHGISGPNPYPALRQSREVVVQRWVDGEWVLQKPNWPFTNFHRGGFTTTGSLGCITTHPNQFDEFLRIAYRVMEIHKQEEIPCIIMEANE